MVRPLQSDYCYQQIHIDAARNATDDFNLFRKHTGEDALIRDHQLHYSNYQFNRRYWVCFSNMLLFIVLFTVLYECAPAPYFLS